MRNIAGDTPQPVAYTTRAATPGQPDTRMQVRAISFLDARQGWLLMRLRDATTEVLATADGGASWSKRFEMTDQAYAMTFVDALNGWMLRQDACYDPLTPVAGCASHLLATRDGGFTWSVVGDPLSTRSRMAWADAAQGWIVSPASCPGCDGLRLLRTDDGGATWDSRDLASVGRSDGVRLFLFGASAVLTGRFGILTTRDGGDTWVAKADGCGEQAFPVLGWFSDASHGWTVCEDGNAGGTVVEKFIYATEDGGATWDLRSRYLWGGQTPEADVGQAPAASVSEMAFSDLTTGWISTSFAVERTDDSGRTWTRLNLDNNSKILFIDSATGFIAAGNTLASTTDGGAQWRFSVITAPGM